MPENAMSVTRPGRYGNPFKIGPFDTRDDIILRHRNYLRAMTPDHLREFLLPLKGKDLACFCPLTDEFGVIVPCHADTLIEFLKELGMDQP